MSLIQPPTYETVAAALALHGATVIVDLEKGGYQLTRSDGSTAFVEYGTPIEEWAAVAAVPTPEVPATPAA